jgi:signal transduction histidine kinase/ActR/RegA family two-component response regulator
LTQLPPQSAPDSPAPRRPSPPTLGGLPLWLQLAATLLLLTITITYVGGEAMRRSESTRLQLRAKDQVEQRLALVKQRLVTALKPQITPQHGQQLDRLLSDFSLLSPDMVQLAVLDSRGQSVAHWRRPGTEGEKLMPLPIPIGQAGQVMGSLVAGWDAAAFDTAVAQSVATVRWHIFLTLVIASAVLLIWLRALVLQPLSQAQRHLLSTDERAALQPAIWLAAEFRQLLQSVHYIDEISTSKEALEQEMERRKDAEVALVAARDEALEANRAKSAFLANMSHELRTPLNAILGYSEMMQEEARAREHQEYTGDLERIHTAGRHLLVLINEILDLSKIEAGKMELHLEAFDLADVVNAVVTTVEPMVNKNHNTIRLLGLDSVPMMRADVTKVRQILFNLLSNAIKFTEHGEITLHTRQQSRHGVVGVEIRVSDTGIGLHTKDMESLFIPFQQADVSTTRKYGGTGLGLALCRRLCDMMQGDIGVESEPGQGATFTVWLPLTVVSDPAAVPAPGVMRNGVPDPRNVRLPSTVLRHLAGHERRKRIATILTIDDDPNVLDLMARVYQREGFRPVSANSGVEGLDLARKLRPDLITLDIMMPEMDGWAVLQSLKDDPELCDIPVIMVSIVENRPMALDIGALASLTKPIAWDRLLELTRSAVRKEATPRT